MGVNAGRVFMRFDDGTQGFVPPHRVKDAQKDGGVVVPVKMKTPSGNVQYVAGQKAGSAMDQGFQQVPDAIVGDASNPPTPLTGTMQGGMNNLRYGAARSLPEAAALAPALIPGAGLPGAAARVATAFGAGTAADMGQRAMMGQPQGLPTSALMGGVNALWQAPFEALGLAFNPVSAARSSMRVPGQKGVAIGDTGPTLLQEKVIPGPKGSFTGTAKTQELLTKARSAEDAMVDAHQAAIEKTPQYDPALGLKTKVPQVSLANIADKAYARIWNKMGQGLSVAERQKLREWSDELSVQKNQGDHGFVSGPHVPQVGHELPATPKDMLQIKRRYDEMATPAYAKMEAGKSGATTDLRQKWVKAVADESRKWLKESVPGIEPLMKRSEDMLRYNRAMMYAEGKDAPEIRDINPMTVLPKMLNSRRAMAQRALTFNKPGVQQAIRKAPGAIGFSAMAAADALRGKR